MKKVKAIRFNTKQDGKTEIWRSEKAIAWLASEQVAAEQFLERDGFLLFEVPEGQPCHDTQKEIPGGVIFEYEDGSLSKYSDPPQDPIDPVDEALADTVLEATENPIGLLDPRLLALLSDRWTKVTDEEFQLRKGYESDVQKDTGNNGRIRMRMTTDREDRVGDTISVDGWVFENYKRNPIILFNHDYGEVGGSPPAQGRSLSVTTRKHAVENDIEFHRKTRFNEELYQMYGGGYMKTGSVGFWPLAKPEERKASNERVGLHFTKQDLLEFSLVAVPANPDAYQLAMKKGLVRPKAVEYLVSTALPLATRPHQGKTGGSTAAPGSGTERTSSARLTAAIVLARAKFQNRLRGL